MADMQSLLLGVIVILVILGICIDCLYLKRVKRINFQKLLLKAEKALEKGKVDRAQKYYKKIIQALE